MKADAVIIGGAGFIGTNLAKALVARGERVRILDNLSRRGVEQNVLWMETHLKGKVEILLGDVRDFERVQTALTGAGSVFHLAAQVAVTTSLDDPLLDFEVNAQGTIHVLEALRRLSRPPPIVFTSTNKVYGDLEDVGLLEGPSRYVPASPELAERGVSERRRLDFHSPYGCSKGAADQYVLDYARCFDLPAIVFRMSCIYGPHQMGNEDQGWVAHFCRRVLEDEELTIYGNGKQVRDLLFVEDLANAFIRAREAATALAGRPFNIGGSARHSLSLIELLQLIEELTGKQSRVTFEDWRTSDQRYYVSDTRAFHQATGWTSATSPREGVAQLLEWLRETRPHTHESGIRPRYEEMSAGRGSR